MYLGYIPHHPELIEEQLSATLIAVQVECLRLQQENARLKAELDYAIGWIDKYEEIRKETE